MRQALEPEQKALEINLDNSIYGAFAEIGAGQEVARFFFSVGAAAGTIAKTMSAYDKIVSDDVYGPEPSGRYVCESRLYKMLDNEWELMEKRLRPIRPDTNFFVFADTVATLNYQRTIRGDGWLGIRFQLRPGGEPNDLVLHVKMLDNDTQLQQQAVGIAGVNLIYACYRYHQTPETLVESLIDCLRGRAVIDMVRLTGPDFEGLDNRLLSLWLVKNGLSKVAMFGPDKQNLHASEFLYKKHVMIVRANFRPPTLLNMDMINKGFRQFRNEPEVDVAKSFVLAEIVLDMLQTEGETDEKDFLDRAEPLCALGQTVVISDCREYKDLIAYMADYRVQNLGILIRAHRLLDVLSKKYYQNMDGRLLSAIGDVFTRNVRLYAYPVVEEDSGELMTARNLPVPEGIKFLYQHLIDNRQIVDVQDCDPGVLSILPQEILEMIRQGKTGWEDKVPSIVAAMIKEKLLFGYPVLEV